MQLRHISASSNVGEAPVDIFQAERRTYSAHCVFEGILWLFLLPVVSTMAYQLYRNTTLGNSLQESLDELIQTQQITPQLALQVLLQFDKAINMALANRVRNRVNFRGSLNTYRFCDNVWTFVLNDVEFREVTDLVKVDKVKIVACDGKSESTQNKNDK
uniref:Transcription initiation factor IIA subunit 2 n=2 Tax=Gasterosteus aculeatus aculeatus TaxID=481459 RepID=A0AAQ4RNM8_GASAC